MRRSEHPWTAFLWTTMAACLACDGDASAGDGAGGAATPPDVRNGTGADSTVEAGVENEVGAEADAGPPPDGGPAPGAETGPEAGPPPEAGPRPDARVDAGLPPEAGAPSDAGPQPPEAGPHPDAGPQPPEAGPSPDAEARTDAAPPPAGAPAERCEDAPLLADISDALAPPVAPFTHRLEADYGEANDYNPLRERGLPPACAIVYDAMGREVVADLVLAPGQTLVTRLTALPDGHPPAIYLMDCATGSWPDVDGSTLCGNNEYGTHGFCALGLCEALEWQFTWPVAVGGVPTQARRFSLVVDEVGADAAERFTLEWGLIGP